MSDDKEGGNLATDDRDCVDGDDSRPRMMRTTARMGCMGEDEEAGAAGLYVRTPECILVA